MNIPNLSSAALTAIGEALAAANVADPQGTAADIRTLQASATGSEILRLIVRDDHGGAASLIAATLWPGL
jgi:hypothetical protein